MINTIKYIFCTNLWILFTTFVDRKYTPGKDQFKLDIVNLFIEILLLTGIIPLLLLLLDNICFNITFSIITILLLISN